MAELNSVSARHLDRVVLRVIDRARIDLVDKPEDLLDGLLQFVVGASQVERPALGLEVIPARPSSQVSAVLSWGTIPVVDLGNDGIPAKPPCLPTALCSSVQYFAGITVVRFLLDVGW